MLYDIIGKGGKCYSNLYFFQKKEQPKTDLLIYAYDTFNRPTSVTYGDGSTVTYEYDSAGRLHRITDTQSGTIDWIYDEVDRVIQEITPQGSVR